VLELADGAHVALAQTELAEIEHWIGEHIKSKKKG